MRRGGTEAYDAAPTAIVTASSARLPSSTVRGFDIHAVPILLQVGSEEFHDGVDLEPDRMYRALLDGVPVKSAAPSPLDYLDAIESCGDRAVLVITPATEFTRMHRNAALAAELAGPHVTVLDSRSAAAAQGLVVAAAAEAAAAGAGPDDVAAAAFDASVRAELVASLESTESLRASGRVPAIALGLAGHLRLRPVFRMRQGEVERLALPRSEEAAMARIVREWEAGGGPAASRAAIFHPARPARAKRLADLLGGSPLITEFSAAMGIHTGPGVAGVAWLRPAEGEPEL